MDHFQYFRGEIREVKSFFHRKKGKKGPKKGLKLAQNHHFSRGGGLNEVLGKIFR